MTPPLDPAVIAAVERALAAGGASQRTLAMQFGISHGSVSNIKAHMGRTKYPVNTPPVEADKKVATYHWKDFIEPVKAMQRLKKSTSWSQDEARIQLGDGKSPVILCGFGDQHIGSYGANYDRFVDMTNDILNTPNLYICLMGDFLEMAIRLRGVLEVAGGQVLTPEMQESFLESWLDDIKHKVAFATWDNHAVMRQEAQAGTSNVKNLLARRCVYHNGIGHSDISVGEQVYKTAASHKFRGGSMFNRLHAQGRYVRQQAADRELVFMGDIHQWAFSATEDAGSERVYITGGTLHENSGYAKRFFSLTTAAHYPCVVLMHDSHTIVPFKSISAARMFVAGWEAMQKAA
jgi:hypothetical protein